MGEVLSRMHATQTLFEEKIRAQERELQEKLDSSPDRDSREMHRQRPGREATVAVRIRTDGSWIDLLKPERHVAMEKLADAHALGRPVPRRRAWFFVMVPTTE